MCGRRGPDHHCGDDIVMVTVMVLASIGEGDWPGGRAVAWKRFRGMTIQNRKVFCWSTIRD